MIINLIFSLFLISNIFAQQGWFKLNVPFGGGGIYFKDISNGIIGEYKTTNAGLSWLYMGSNAGGTSISFPVPNTGYGVVAASIVKTTDFGNNWVYQNYPSNAWLYSVDFMDVNTGFACGETKLVKTTNGGINWLTESLPLNSNSYIFENVFFVDLLTGYIAGNRGSSNDTSVFLKTTNGGVNWNAQFFTVSAWGKFTSMFFVNANTGFIGSSAKILKTTNGGVSWYEAFLPTANRINDIFFPSGPIGYACCFGGQILKTTDSGYNWFLQTTGTGSNLNRLFFLNNLTGYCAGEFAVLKTTDGGGPPIGINPVSSEIPNEFQLEQNYPNPFNPITSIKYSLKHNSWVTIIIYNILGQEVKRLVDDYKYAGYNTVVWDGTNNYGNHVSSGIYFYKLTAGYFIDQKKMVIIR